MQKKENLTFERKHTNNIHHSLWYDSQEEESRKCPERDGRVRMWDIYLLNSDSDQKKKEWKTAFCNNVDGPRVNHTRWRVSGIEQKAAYDFMRWCRQINTNIAIYKAETYSRNQTMNWCLMKQKAKWRDILGVQR